MRATIHLLPWSRGAEVSSVDVNVPDGLTPEAAAEHLFEASNIGEATVRSRSMSVGDAAEVFTACGRVLLGCCPSGWVRLHIDLLPAMTTMSQDLRSRIFSGLAKMEAIA